MRRAGRSAVYNLTVADQHTYFAGGVLVHNCDAARYDLMDAFATERVLKPKRLVVGGQPHLELSDAEEMAQLERARLQGLIQPRRRW